jgi:hypothetical protein
MLFGIMMDPFASSSADTLISAIRAVQTTILQAWPRMPAWYNDTTQALVVCWLNVADQNMPSEKATGTGTRSAVQTELIKTFKVLTAAMPADDNRFADVVEPLLSKDESLRALLGASP